MVSEVGFELKPRVRGKDREVEKFVRNSSIGVRDKVAERRKTFERQFSDPRPKFEWLKEFRTSQKLRRQRASSSSESVVVVVRERRQRPEFRHCPRRVAERLRDPETKVPTQSPNFVIAGRGCAT